MKKWIIALIIAMPGLSFAANKAPQPLPPDQVVQQIVSQVKHKLQGHQKALRTHQKKLFDLVDSTIVPHVDFPYMSRLVLGRAWRKATPKQRKEFTEAFRTMLVRTYANALLEYSDTQVKFDPLHMKKGASAVSVTGTAKLPSGQVVPVKYQLHLVHDQWKIYNISIDNLSLVINYRGVFDNEIRRHGIDTLIKRLQAKNQSVLGGK